MLHCSACPTSHQRPSKKRSAVGTPPHHAHPPIQILRQTAKKFETLKTNRICGLVSQEPMGGKGPKGWPASMQFDMTSFSRF